MIHPHFPFRIDGRVIDDEEMNFWTVTILEPFGPLKAGEYYDMVSLNYVKGEGVARNFDKDDRREVTFRFTVKIGAI